VFEVPAHKNISFRTEFGSVRINGVDLMHLTSAAKAFGGSRSETVDWHELKRSLTNLKKMQDDLSQLNLSVNGMLNFGQIRPLFVFQAANGYRKLQGRVRKLNQVSIDCKHKSRFAVSNS
jgi:hypothetical protein